MSSSNNFVSIIEVRMVLHVSLGMSLLWLGASQVLSLTVGYLCPVVCGVLCFHLIDPALQFLLDGVALCEFACDEGFSLSIASGFEFPVTWCTWCV